MNQSPSLCVVVSAVVCALLHLSLGDSSGTIIVKINPPYIKYVRPNSSFAFFCEISKSLKYLTNTLQTEFVFKAPDNRPAVVLSNLAAVFNTTRYNVSPIKKLVEGVEGVRLTLNIITVQDLDEGNYTCLVKNRSDDQILAQDSTQLSVLRPIEDLCIKVADQDKICHLKVEPIEIDQGKFTVNCTAQGSNPAPSVHLYHLDQAITPVDNKTELQDIILSRYRSSVTATVNVPFSTTKQEIICVGESELNNKTIKFPYKLKEYEPDIVCNKCQARKGQQTVILTCSVDLKGQNVTQFLAESNNQTFAFDKLWRECVEVRHENVTQTAVKISLVLPNDQDQDFTNFYLILQHPNGEKTRHSVVVPPLSGARPARGIATSFIPLRLESLVLLVGVLAWR